MVSQVGYHCHGHSHRPLETACTVSTAERCRKSRELVAHYRSMRSLCWSLKNFRLVAGGKEWCLELLLASYDRVVGCPFRPLAPEDHHGGLVVGLAEEGTLQIDVMVEAP